MELQKNYFQMISAVAATFFLFLTLQALFPQDARAEGDQKALALRNNVVRIIAKQGEDDEGGKGFGFIIAIRLGKATVVTANHVLRGWNPSEPHIPKHIDIFFFSNQGKKYEAEMLSVHSPELDIAFLEVSIPAGFSIQPDCLDTDVSIHRKKEVYYVGRGDEWYVPTDSGKISSNEARLGKFKIDDLNVQPGTSGAPLITENGIVGMVIADSGVATEAVTIGTIATEAKYFNLPWELTAAKPTTPQMSPQPGASPTGKGPREIVLKTELGKKPVKFNHAKHQSKYACGECHHGKGANGKLIPYTEGQVIGKCGNCHNSTMDNQELNEFKRAAHKNCMECHKQKESGGAPVKCEGCHPKESAFGQPATPSRANRVTSYEGKQGPS